MYLSVIVILPHVFEIFKDLYKISEYFYKTYAPSTIYDRSELLIRIRLAHNNATLLPGDF